MPESPGSQVPAAGYPDHLREQVDAFLESVKLPGDGPVAGLVDDMRYSLLAGGKRIRPVLTLATQAAIGGDLERVMPLAAAIEMIHTYSLIHDDLPAMDDDDLRRGKPTLHRRSGEAAAILAGDGLYAEAFALLLANTPGNRERLADCAAALASATGLDGMVGGQYLDVEGFSGDGAEGLRQLHELKTGRLIHASCDCVLILEDESGPEADAIRLYAKELGLLFQIVDDILDVTGTDSRLGKPAGSDERQGKRTFVTEFGVEGAAKLAEECHASATGAIDLLGDRATELRAIADHVATRNS